ncbi:MAG: PAS domain-containing sensor histidine kinase [Candidatus Micrarchaeia archaeon]
MKFLKPISPDATRAFQQKYESSSKTKQLVLRHIHPRKFNALLDDMVSQKRLCSDVVEQLGQGIVVLDSSMRITIANPELGRMLGQDPALAIGKNAVELFAPYLDKAQMDVLSSQIEARKKGEKGSYELEAVVGGKRKTLLMTSTPRTDKNGRILGSMAIIEDITERKMAYENLEMFFRGVHHSPVAITITSLSGNTIYANKSYEELAGAPLEKLRGKIPLTLANSPLRQMWSDGEFARIAGGASWKGKLTPTDGNCKGAVLETTVSPVIGKDGKAFGFLIIHEDVTELVKLGEELSAKNLALKEAVDRLSQLMSILFHDIKNPLMHIEGFCVTIDEDHGEKMPDDARKFLQVIHGAAVQINSIINDLSDWASASKMAPEPLFLQDLVAKAIELQRISAEKKGIEISGEYAGGMAFADRKMLFFVLRNLIANSVKFTEQGGFIHVASSLKGDFMEVSVTDNGVGIAPWRLDPAHKYNIFDGGMHASTEGTKGEKGTGFGIRQCKEFVEQMGGKFWAESNTAAEARGTTFFFTLPMNPPETPSI